MAVHTRLKDSLIILIGTGETAFSVVLAVVSETEEGVTWLSLSPD